MKITIVLPFASLNGGVRVAATYAAELIKRGHEVLVVSQPYKRAMGRKERLMVLLGLANRPFGVVNPLISDLGSHHKTLDEKRPVMAPDVPDADVILATWWETAEWISKLPPQKGRKAYLIQGYEANIENQPKDRVIATYKLQLKRLAVSNFVRRCIQEWHGAGDTTVVPNAVDTQHFKVDGPRKKADKLTIGFIYAASPMKNVILAIEALARVRKIYPELKVVAFGSTKEQPTLPIPDWISYQLAPDQADIPKLYARCDAWLFPSIEEGFGLPILEAMSCGTPVLATSAGAAPDIIDGKNGELLDWDTDAFVQAILAYAEMSEEDWAERSRYARQTAEQHNWDHATTRLERALEDLVTQKDCDTTQVSA